MKLVPKYKVGDIVSSIDDSNELYVVRESIYRENTDKYLYDVSPLLSCKNGATDDIYTYYESVLSLQYHDTQKVYPIMV